MSPTLSDCLIVGGIGLCMAAIALYVRAVIGFGRRLDRLAATSPTLVGRRNL